MAALVAVAVIAVVVATGSGLGLSDMDRLKQQPEASLFFPGSALIRDGGHEAIVGGSAALIWNQLGTNASMDDVLSFYRGELAARGWATGGGSSTLSRFVERQTCAWHTEDRIVRVSFWKPAKFRERYPSDPDYATVYELSLIGRGSTSNLTACTIGIGE